MESNILGIVCARVGSKRFPNKNIMEINGKPLITIAKEKLESLGIETVVITNYEMPYETVIRPDHLEADDAALQDVVLWYLNEWVGELDDIDAVIVLMPTNPLIHEEDIEEAIYKYRNTGCNIVRSYDVNGEENGLYLIDYDYLVSNQHAYDTYTCSIYADGIEIHTEDDLEFARRVLHESD